MKICVSISSDVFIDIPDKIAKGRTDELEAYLHKRLKTKRIDPEIQVVTDMDTGDYLIS